MKRKFFLLCTCILISMSLVGCSKNNNPYNVPTDIEFPEFTSTPIPTVAPTEAIPDINEEIKNTPTPVPTVEPTPTNTPTPIPDIETPEKVVADFENIYWINEEYMIGYYFYEGNIIAKVLGQEMIGSYSYEGNSITAGTYDENNNLTDIDTVNYQIIDDTLIMETWGDIVFSKSDKESFDNLFNFSEDEKPPVDSDSAYVGMTINDFVKTGADIKGYYGLGDTCDFKAVNKDLFEMYIFNIDCDDVDVALEGKGAFDDYEDFLGEYHITQISIIKPDVEYLQQYVGQTVSYFIENEEGYDISGFFYSLGSLELNAYKGMQMYYYPVITIKLGDDAAKKYDTLEDPFDVDMGNEFADFIIEKIEYSLY